VVVDTSNGYTFLYSNGNITEIGTPPHIGSPNFVSGNAISSTGEVVGSQNGQPFFYNGTFNNIANVSQADAVGIDGSGEMVGDFYTGSNYSAFTYNGGTSFTNFGGLVLNDPSDNTEAYAINSHGEIVGVMHGVIGGDIAGNPFGVDGNAGSTAFAVGVGQYRILDILNSTGSCATSINDSGEYVGYYDTATETDAFLYNGSQYEEIGQLSSFPNAVGFLEINAGGEIINDKLNGQVGAYLDTGSGFVDLNTLIDPNAGWTLLAANGINDAGQIVGYGSGPDGNTDAFLLTPVPEPATGVLAIAESGAILLLRRQREFHASNH